jgi:nickel/cobalt transporter (NicO) family protein
VRRRIELALFALCGALAVLLAAPVSASAHPLGNFTTNRYDEVVVSGDRVYVHAVVDLAEIPTFQAKGSLQRLGRAGYADSLVAKVTDGIVLTVAGEDRTLAEARTSLVFPKGVGGLRTTRLDVVFDAGPARDGVIALRDESFSERIGWREIVVSATRDASVETSSVPASTVSDRLRTYPGDMLQSPLDVRSATATTRAGDEAGVAPVFDGRLESPERGGEGGFASLIEREDLSVGFVLIALVLALFWGAAHALTPGHGKAIVAAYLMGTKGRPRDALALGGIVTVTHTIGVFALGIATLALSEFIVPEDLYPWMNLVSALLVVCVGIVVLRDRVRVARAPHGHHHHGHDHSHGHHHHEGMTDEEHARAHLPEQGSGTRGLLAVGISGGLIPCPTALVVLLAAISLHKVAFGLVLIVAFSIGLASVISAIGLLAIGARQTFGRVSFEGPVIRALPAVSALLVFGIGVVMTARAVPSLL